MSIWKDRYGYVRAGWVVPGILAVVLAVVFLIVLGGMTFVNKPACFRTADGLGLRADWGILTGCRVEVNGRLVPLDSIRVTDNGEVLLP